MKFGLFSMNQGVCIDPAVATRIARVAEDAGFDSLWVGEHVVLPDPRVAPSPMEPTDPILDPVVALTFLAATTSRVRLGTGIIILPQRNPLVLAKELASLDVLSGGRLILGIGAGYLQPEFAAIGVPFKDHGRRTDEYMAAMRTLWSAEQPAYEGRYVSFSGVNAYPRTVQQPMPELVIGGRSPGALRRTVEQAHGWYGYNLDLDATAQNIANINAAAARFSRPPGFGDVEVSITPPDITDYDTARRYADLGVARLILRPPRELDADAVVRMVEDVGKTLIGRV